MTHISSRTRSAFESLLACECARDVGMDMVTRQTPPSRPTYRYSDAAVAMFLDGRSQHSSLRLRECLHGNGGRASSREGYPVHVVNLGAGFLTVNRVP